MVVKKRKHRGKLKRKSAKANKRLLTIIGVIAAMLFVAGGAAWFFLEYRGARRNINIGDNLVAEGNFRDAEKQYGRAITKDPANLEYVMRWRDTLKLITPNTPTEADSFYKKYLMSLQHVARYNPLNIDAQLAVVEELYRAAYLTSADGYWNQVLASTQSGLERISQNDPRRHELILYNALATLHVDNKSMTDTISNDGLRIQFPGEDLIETVLESDPSNAIAWAALAHGRMAVYHRLVVQGRTQQAARSRDFADETLQDALEIGGNNIDIAETELREMLLRRTAFLLSKESDSTSFGKDSLDVIETSIWQARDRAIEAYDPNEHYYRTSQLVSLLLSTGAGSREIATEILRLHIKENPNDTGRQFMLAMLLQQRGMYEESTEIAKTILDIPQLQMGLYAIQQFLVRPQAAQLLVILSTDQSRDNEGEERAAFLASAKQYREVLADLVSQKTDDPFLMYADGLLAISEGRYKEAASLLEALILRNPEVSTQAYREAAFALAQSGAIGLAHERLAVALDREKGLLANYLLKARIEMMIADFDSAAATLNQLGEEEKGRPEVQELLNFIALNKKEEGTRFTDPVLAMVAASERAIALGKYEDAKAILLEGISQSPTPTPDWRLFAAMSNIYTALDDMEEAAVWMRKAIAEDPENKVLTNTLLAIEIDDEIAAGIAIVEAMGLDDAEKAELIAVGLFTKAMRKFEEADRLAQMGNTEESETTRSIGNRALEESDVYQLKAEAAGADMTNINVIRFEQAIAKLDISLSSNLFEKISALTDDSLIVDGLRVRLLLAQATIAKNDGDQLEFDIKANEALVLAKSMTSEVPFSASAWITLGLSYSALGQHMEALPAFEEASRIAPNDKENIRKYIASLRITDSDPQRRLRVIRSARERFPDDKHFKTIWLREEQASGDNWKVINYHFERYKIHPDENENRLRLAYLLVNTEPDREYVRNADGTEVYSVRNWNQMAPINKREAIQQLRDSWDEVVNEIVKETDEKVAANVNIALLHASLAKDLGRLEQASEIWDRFIKSREDTESYTQAVITAANFLHTEGRSQQAIAILKEAKEKNPDQHAIDAAIGTIFFLVSNYEEAATHLSAAVADSNNGNIYSMWIESLVFSGQFESAEQAMKTFKSADNPYGNAMLRGLISRVKAEQLLAQGNIIGGTAELTSYRNHLQEAINTNPTFPVAYIRLAKSLLGEYRLTQDQSLLEESLEVVNQGFQQIETQAQFAVIRADVLQAAGQLHNAVEHLKEFLAKKPDSAETRHRLIDAYLDMDDFDKAIAIATAGIELDPSEPTWYQRVGNLHLRANDDRGEAVKVFISALKRRPNAQLLLLVDSITRTKQLLPNRDLLTLVQGNLSKMHPISGSIEAKSLKNLGRSRDALIAMEKSWHTFENSIANGWLPPSSSLDWYLDLREFFDEDPNAGEELIYKLAGSDLSNHQLAGLAAYWKAFGNEGINKAVLIIEEAVTNTEAGSNARLQFLTLLGTYLVDAARYEESEKIFRQLSEEHDSPAILNNLAYVIGIYLNRPEEGLALAKQAVVKMPRNVSLIDTVASLHSRAGNYKEAAETLEYLLQVEPSRASAMSQLAVLYSEHLEQPERGVVFAERARSQTPRSPEVLDALGWSYYQMGRISAGEEYILNSLKRGETMDAYIHLAQVVTSQSKHDEALDHLRMAQELAQDEHSLNRIKVLQDDIRKTKSLSDM